MATVVNPEIGNKALECLPTISVKQIKGFSIIVSHRATCAVGRCAVDEKLTYARIRDENVPNINTGAKR